MHQVGSKKDWVLTPAAFDRLLSWLDEGVSSEGQKYLEMRRRLVGYFGRKNCSSPDDLADETLNRLARRLEEEGSIDTPTPAQYCYTVARFVLLEFLRKTKSQSLDHSTLVTTVDSALDEGVDKMVQERRWECLKHCIENISEQSRELIINYYYGDQGVKIQNRRALAAKLDVTANALSIRAWRIRSKLETCVKKCIEKSEIVS